MVNLFAVAILWLLTLSSALAGSFVRPTAITPSAVSSLHDKLLGLQANFSRINKVLEEKTENNLVISTQLGQFQTSIGKIHKQVNNLHRQSQNENKGFAKQVESLSTLVTLLQRELNELKKKNGRQASWECVQDILSNEFEEARKQFDLVDSENRIKYIVDQVFNNNNGAKFSLVLTFADGLSKTNNTLQVYKALGEQFLRVYKGNSSYDDLSTLIERIESFGVTSGEPLRSLRAEGEPTAANRCVEKIVAKDFAEARKYVDMVDSDDRIKSIVQRAYSRAKLVPVQDFAAALECSSKAGKVYKELAKQVVLTYEGTIKDNLSRNLNIMARMCG